MVFGCNPSMLLLLHVIHPLVRALLLVTRLQVNAQHGTTFGSVDYVRRLLEHLRTARMIKCVVGV